MLSCVASTICVFERFISLRSHPIGCVGRLPWNMLHSLMGHSNHQNHMLKMIPMKPSYMYSATQLRAFGIMSSRKNLDTPFAIFYDRPFNLHSSSFTHFSGTISLLPIECSLLHSFERLHQASILQHIFSLLAYSYMLTSL